MITLRLKKLQPGFISKQLQEIWVSINNLQHKQFPGVQAYSTWPRCSGCQKGYKNEDWRFLGNCPYQKLLTFSHVSWCYLNMKQVSGFFLRHGVYHASHMLKLQTQFDIRLVTYLLTYYRSSHAYIVAQITATLSTPTWQVLCHQHWHAHTPHYKTLSRQSPHNLNTHMQCTYNITPYCGVTSFWTQQ